MLGREQQPQGGDREAPAHDTGSDRLEDASFGSFVSRPPNNWGEGGRQAEHEGRQVGDTELGPLANYVGGEPLRGQRLRGAQKPSRTARVVGRVGRSHGDDEIIRAPASGPLHEHPVDVGLDLVPDVDGLSQVAHLLGEDRLAERP